jgi:hypothetical protein
MRPEINFPDVWFFTVNTESVWSREKTRLDALPIALMLDDVRLWPEKCVSLWILWIVNEANRKSEKEFTRDVKLLRILLHLFAPVELGSFFPLRDALSSRWAESNAFYGWLSFHHISLDIICLFLRSRQAGTNRCNLCTAHNAAQRDDSLFTSRKHVLLVSQWKIVIYTLHGTAGRARVLPKVIFSRKFLHHAAIDLLSSESFRRRARVWYERKIEEVQWRSSDGMWCRVA